jgi:hypothetical protein
VCALTTSVNHVGSWLNIRKRQAAWSMSITRTRTSYYHVMDRIIVFLLKQPKMESIISSPRCCKRYLSFESEMNVKFLALVL